MIDLDVFIVSMVFISPILFASFVLLAGNKITINKIFPVISILISIFCTILVWKKLNLSESKVIEINEIFYIDGFSILMQLMIEIVALITILYSPQYLAKLYSHRKNKFHLYYSTILYSTAFMNLSFVLNNLFLIYIFLELSTILVIYLIAFNLQKEDLKASFKYLLFINVGILFSLLGIILLSYFTGTLIFLSNISFYVASLPKHIALIFGVLFIIGFFTKSGLIPFHVWLPDSYSESPSPITVFLAGAVTKIGFYGIIRTVSVFSFHYLEIQTLVIILSSLSMFFGAVLAFNQRDLKKMIAYCSISEMGFIASALVLNSYMGILGGVFHLINHTLMKGILFFSTGILIFAYGSSKIDEIRKSVGNISMVSPMFFIGALAVAGMPMFGSFLSSITIFLALTESGFLLTSIILILSGFISGLALLRTAIFLFWSKKEQNRILNKIQLPTSMVLSTLVFTFLLIIFGVLPEIIYPLLEIATSGIIKMLH